MTGLSEAYILSDEFAVALAVVVIALTGDPTAGTYSIGGLYTPGLLYGLLFDPEGISFSLNAYESDASPGRVSQGWSSPNNYLTKPVARCLFE